LASASAESGLGKRGNRDAEETKLQLLLMVTRLKAAEHLLGQPEQRVGEELIDLHLQPTENLKSRLVRRNEATNRLRATE
jgi:hypothetical protein